MLRRSCLVVALALVASGCASPTLPLPPPETPVVTFEGDDTVVLKGSAMSDAIVYAFNEDQEQGVFNKATAFGTYTLKLKAQAGNSVAIWQEIGNDRSPSILVLIRKP